MNILEIQNILSSQQPSGGVWGILSPGSRLSARVQQREGVGALDVRDFSSSCTVHFINSTWYGATSGDLLGLSQSTFIKSARLKYVQ